MSLDGHVFDLDVLLPIRPRPPRLRSVLESLISQDYTNWRLVVLLDRDDGRNRAIVMDAVKKAQVEFIECDYTREGFSGMLNKGLAHATGSYVARQDDDDLSSSHRFSSQIRLLENRPDVIMATGFASVVNRTGEIRYQITQPTHPRDLALALIGTNIIPHSSAMFKKESILAVGGYDNNVRGCEDYELWLRLLSVGNIATVGSEIIEILQHPDGMSKKGTNLTALTRVNRGRFVACRLLNVSPVRAMKYSVAWSVKQLVPRGVPLVR